MYVLKHETIVFNKQKIYVFYFFYTAGCLYYYYYSISIIYIYIIPAIIVTVIYKTIYLYIFSHFTR